MARITGITKRTTMMAAAAFIASTGITVELRNRSSCQILVRKIRANPIPIGLRKGVMHRAMTHKRMKAGQNLRFLHMSNAGLKARSKERSLEPSADEYQLQLRVSEDFYKYMEELERRAGVETKSELVRFALRELDRVRREYDGIMMPDGQAVEAGEAKERDDRRIVPFRKATAKRRIVVALRGAANQRLQRLIGWLGGMPLVDLVAIALGVLDTLLTIEEEKIRSSSAKQSAQVMTGETAEIEEGKVMSC